jgi:hypothetical protein
MKTVKKAALVLATAGLAAGSAAGSAYADSTTEAAVDSSPGVLSGNLAQLPVHVPMDLCGNSVNVAGLLNPAFGTGCAGV